jgi:mRNA interferase MazF
MRRGEIWWASLPVPQGSEPGYRRPLLVIQSDDFNRSRIQTVVAVVITSNLRLADAPGNVVLSAKDSGLPRRSVVNVSQLITVDKSFLTEKVGRLAPDKIREIEMGIRLVLAL